MKNRVYLDNNAGTCVDPHIIPILMQHLKTIQGNPSSTHTEGLEARNVLNQARNVIANFLKAKPSEIIFNSGGTEGLNTILRGIGNRGHMVTSSVEHPAVYATIKSLEAQGLQATYLNPGLGVPLLRKLLQMP